MVRWRKFESTPDNGVVPITLSSEALCPFDIVPRLLDLLRHGRLSHTQQLVEVDRLRLIVLSLGEDRRE